MTHKNVHIEKAWAETTHVLLTFQIVRKRQRYWSQDQEEGGMSKQMKMSWKNFTIL